MWFIRLLIGIILLILIGPFAIDMIVTGMTIVATHPD